VDDGSVIQSRKVEGADIYGMVDQLSSFVIEDLNLGVIETVDLAVSKKTSSNVTAYSHYVTGNDYLNYGKFIEAVVELQEAVKMDPTFKKAMYKLAIAQWWSKGAEVASSDSATISTLDTYLSLPDLDKDEVKLAEGVKNIVSNKFIDALESFEYLTEIYPDNKEYWYLLGESHFHGTLKDYKALNAFEKAMNLDPEFDLASFHIIHLYTKEEKFDKAVEMLEKKLKTNPDSPSLLNNLGTVRYSQGELAEAINIADKVLSVDPNNWNSAWGKALGLIGLGEFEKADASISHLNRLSPNLWPVFVMESGLYFSHGKFIERRELLINKYKFEKDVPAKIGLAIGVLFTDCLAKDKKRLEKDVELFSGIGDTEKSRYWEFVYWMSFAHSLLDNPGLAINYQKILMGLETSEARKPWQNAYIIDSNVDIAMREGDWKGVITKFRDYDGSGAHNAIMSLSRYKKCEAEFNLNKYDISLMTAKKMSSPNQHFVGFVFCQSFGFYWQGRIYEEKGETQEAISAYESLMELWKDGDERLPKRKDAIKRLANLKKTS
jgi:tetratricopeptide (TPR) repeat protein